METKDYTSLYDEDFGCCPTCGRNMTKNDFSLDGQISSIGDERLTLNSECIDVDEARYLTYNAQAVAELRKISNSIKQFAAAQKTSITVSAMDEDTVRALRENGYTLERFDTYWRVSW